MIGSIFIIGVAFYHDRLKNNQDGYKSEHGVHLLRTKSVFRVEKFYMKGCDGFLLWSTNLEAEKEFSFKVFLTIEE